MSAFRRYILLALLTGFSGPGFPTAAGTAPDAPDFNFTHYNSGNSELPYDRVNKIVQDSQGFIWFGTSSGLSRFDGIRFRNYTKEEMGLKSAYVIALCTDSEGNLWIEPTAESRSTTLTGTVSSRSSARATSGRSSATRPTSSAGAPTG